MRSIFLTGKFLICHDKECFADERRDLEKIYDLFYNPAGATSFIGVPHIPIAPRIVSPDSKNKDLLDSLRSSSREEDDKAWKAGWTEMTRGVQISTYRVAGGEWNELENTGSRDSQ